MPDIPKMLETAKGIKQRYDEILLRAQVTDSGEARVSASLCLTISEQFAGTVCLVENGFSSHAPTLVRPMLEGLANLINLVEDANYLDQIRFENARSDAIMFDEFAADPGIQEDKQAIATLASWREKAVPLRDELASKGFGEKTVPTKLRMAKISQTYVGYRVLCSVTHNQLSTLIARHAGTFLHYHFEAPTSTTANFLTMAVTLLNHAFSLLSSFTNITEDDVKAALIETDARWSEVLQEH
jgi:hypothetical protein